MMLARTATSVVLLTFAVLAAATGCGARVTLPQTGGVMAATPTAGTADARPQTYCEAVQAAGELLGQLPGDATISMLARRQAATRALLDVADATIRDDLEVLLAGYEQDIATTSGDAPAHHATPVRTDAFEHALFALELHDAQVCGAHARGPLSR